jgi:hypothetical protein
LDVLDWIDQSLKPRICTPGQFIVEDLQEEILPMLLPGGVKRVRLCDSLVSGDSLSQQGVVAPTSAWEPALQWLVGSQSSGGSRFG